MKLNVKERSGAVKKEAKRLRRDGDIPAVLYGVHREAEKIAVSTREFSAVLRQIKAGSLSTVTFTLDVEGKEIRALLKDIQYDRTTYRVIHLDFEELKDDVTVRVNVPIYCVDVAECPGVKLGGQVRQVIRQVSIECLPPKMPKEFTLSVKNLSMRQTKRVSDIVVPEGVKVLTPLTEVAVVIAKR